jgi:KDO2-lipid IV(A) lauroyltransferase
LHASRWPEGVFVPVSSSARRDVRFGGDWSASQRAKNALIALSVAAALRVVDRVPRRWLLAMGRAAGRTIRRLAGRSREQARNALANALSGDSSSIARSCFDHAGENLATSLLLRRTQVRALDLVEVPQSTAETFRAALAHGRGVVFVSAHVGPFEAFAAAVAELGLRPAVVVRESYDPRLDVLIDSHRRTRGIDVIHRGRPGAAIRILRALRAGQPVGFLPDFGGRVPSLEVPFLGEKRPFPVGPQQLAQHARAPLLVGALERQAPFAQEPRFRLVLAAIDTSGSLVTLTARVATELESVIVRAARDFPWMALRPTSVHQKSAS